MKGYTFDLFIAGIRHVYSWGVAPLILVYAIKVSEHRSDNDFHVIVSIVILLFCGMLVQFGSLGIF